MINSFQQRTTLISLLSVLPFCGVTIVPAHGTSGSPPEFISFQNFEDPNDYSAIVYSVGSRRIDIGRFNNAPAQAFIARKGGRLSSVTARIRRNRSFFDEPLIVEIRSSIADLPGQILASVTVPAEVVPVANGFVTFDFSQEGIELMQDDFYFTVFRTENNPDPGFDLFGFYTLRTFDVNAESAGQNAISSPTGGSPPWNSSILHDQEIGLIVTVVPEPSSCTLILGTCCMFWIGRRLRW